MSEPITPRFMADTVLMQTLSINFNPAWDGVNWILTPSDITLKGLGNLSENGIEVGSADLQIVATDLPPAGQTALIELYNFMEEGMATKYG